MKKTILVAVLLFAPALAMAQQASPAAPKTSDGLTPEEVRTFREAMTILQEGFAPAPPAAAQSAGTQASPPPVTVAAQQKNMADVADRVVDLGARAIAQAAGTVEKVAPEVWRIMIRQQYAKAVGELVVPGGLFFLMVFAWFRTRVLRARLSSKADDRDKVDKDNEAVAIIAGYIGPLIGMFIFGVWFLNRLSDSVLYLFNPEYYAFRDLLVMILNKGQVF